MSHYFGFSTYAAYIAHNLLCQFGKNTAVLMTSHGNTVRIIRANDSALIATLYINGDHGSEGYVLRAGHSAVAMAMYDDASRTNGKLARTIMNLPQFPQNWPKKRNWSPIVNKEVEGAY